MMHADKLSIGMMLLKGRLSMYVCGRVDGQRKPAAELTTSERRCHQGLQIVETTHPASLWVVP